VERFYLSHGYEQREVMVRMPPGVPAPDSEGLNILRRRAIGGCEAFNIPADGYAPEANRELKRRLGAAEVIGIFHKTLPPRPAALSGDARL
jgi:hypothetical protein